MESTVFIEVACWNRLAEIVEKYCEKGDPLFVEGKLKLDEWDDREGGGKRSKITITAENIQLLGGRRDESRRDEGRRGERGYREERGRDREERAPRREERGNGRSYDMSKSAGKRFHGEGDERAPRRGDDAPRREVRQEDDDIPF